MLAPGLASQWIAKAGIAVVLGAAAGVTLRMRPCRCVNAWDGGPFMFWFVIDFKIGFNFVDLGVPAAPAGQIYIPACGSLRDPQFGR